MFFKKGRKRGIRHYSVVDLKGSATRKRVEVHLPKSVHIPASTSTFETDDEVIDDTVDDEPDKDLTVPQLVEDADVEDGDKTSFVGPSAYQIRRRQVAKNWEKIRNDLVCTYFSHECLDDRAVCCDCGSCALLRCKDCGPSVFYCEGCCSSQHQWRNVFHVPEIWKVRSM